MKRRILRKCFKKKWYTEQEIEHHYNFIKFRNEQNKRRYKEIEDKNKEIIEKAKKYFKKVKVSLKWDWIWYNNDFCRMFLYFNEIENAILFFKE